MALQVERVPIASLTPDPENPRTHDAKNREAIRQSLVEFGQVVPVVVRRESRQIVGGNERVSVMAEIGWAAVDVVFVDIPEQKARALSIALNRTGELGAWDLDLLASYAAESPDLLLGFSDDDLNELLAGYTEPLRVEEVPQVVPARLLDAAHQGAQERVQIGTVLTGTPTHHSTADYLGSSTKKFEFYCRQADFEEVRRRLDLVRKREKLESNSEVVLFLLRAYEEGAK